MKVLLLVCTIALSGCASSTPDTNKMILKAISYIPMTTKRHLNSIDHYQLKEIIVSGLQKLPLEDLYKLNNLKLKLLEKSENDCTAIFEESLLNSERTEMAFSKLSPEDSEIYARLMAKSISFGSNYDLKDISKPTQDEFKAAATVALSSSTLKYAQLNSTSLSSNEQSCSNYKKLATYVDQNRNSTSETLLRFMAEI